VRKGISQVLTIIVTALVLLTAALAVVAAVLGGLDSSTGSLDTQTCITAVQSQCRSGVTDQVAAPQSCFNQEGEVPQNMRDQVKAGSPVEGYESSDQIFTCAGSDGGSSGGGGGGAGIGAPDVETD
jgi:hypothetical protein